MKRRSFGPSFCLVGLGSCDVGERTEVKWSEAKQKSFGAQRRPYRVKEAVERRATQKKNRTPGTDLYFVAALVQLRVVG